MHHSQNAAAAHTLLGPGAEFEGKLFFEGTVKIDGKFRGEVISADTLIIGEHAEVEGHIEVGTLVVDGWVRCEVKAQHGVILNQHAKFYGSLVTPRLEIAPGAMFEGSSCMEKAMEQALSIPEQDSYERMPIVHEALAIEE